MEKYAIGSQWEMPDLSHFGHRTILAVHPQRAGREDGDDLIVYRRTFGDEITTVFAVKRNQFGDNWIPRRPHWETGVTYTTYADGVSFAVKYVDPDTGDAFGYRHWAEGTTLPTIRNHDARIRWTEATGNDA